MLVFTLKDIAALIALLFVLATYGLLALLAHLKQRRRR